MMPKFTQITYLSTFKDKPKTFKYSWVILILTFFSVLPSSLFAQKWTLFKKNDSLDCRFFLTDHLHNIYIITNKSEVLKYDAEGYFDSRFSFKKFGKIVTADVTNPFKIILHYADYQTIVIIDGELNPIKTLNLNDMGVSNAAAIAMSDAGYIWIYDSGVNKILRFSIESSGYNLTYSSPPLSMSGLQATQMLVRDNKIYLNVPSKGILIFDQFGKFVKDLDIKNASGLQIIENQLFYKQNNKLFRFNLQTLATANVNLPEGVNGDRYMQIQKGRFFVQRYTSIDVYDEKQ